MSFGNIRHLFRVSGGNQDARGAFVEGQHFGAEVAIEIDLRADFVGAETALGRATARPPSLDRAPIRQAGDTIETARAFAVGSSAGAGPKAAARFLGVLCAAEATSSQVPDRPAG
jgi:hypothetical protein